MHHLLYSSVNEHCNIYHYYYGHCSRVVTVLCKNRMYLYESFLTSSHTHTHTHIIVCHMILNNLKHGTIGSSKLNQNVSSGSLVGWFTLTRENKYITHKYI